MMVPERERGIMRVLLVEDDGAIVRTLSELLADEGFSVVTEATQDGACTRLAAESFDIALLDVTLAQGNGFAVCAAAREVVPDMPVIFLTASDDEYSTVAGLDMGAVDYIAKPFRARELVSRMRGALRRTSPADNVLTMGDVRLNVTSGAVRCSSRLWNTGCCSTSCSIRASSLPARCCATPSGTAPASTCRTTP